MNQFYHLHVDIIIIPVVPEEADRVRFLAAGLRIHEIVVEGRDRMDSAQDLRWRDKAMPFSRVVGLDKFNRGRRRRGNPSL